MGESHHPLLIVNHLQKKSMPKTIILITWGTFGCLCYMAIANGMDKAIGVAMAVNIVSNIINMIYLKREKE